MHLQHGSLCNLSVHFELNTTWGQVLFIFETQQAVLEKLWNLELKDPSSNLSSVAYQIHDSEQFN